MKAVTVFAGARDQYQLPIALQEADLLEALVTDLYLPADQTWFFNTFGAVLPADLIAKRFRSALPGSKVQLSGRSLVASLAGRVLPGLRLNRYMDRSLSRKARDTANRAGAALVCYSYYASEAFREGPERPPYRFLFQLHPHPQSARTILCEEMERVPQARLSLLNEHEMFISEADFGSLSQEPCMANGWMVASRFTAHTLAEHGIPSEKIHTVPYGVDSTAFPARPHPPQHHTPFTVIFVGSMVQRKGLSYLLDAVRLANPHGIRVLLCGRGYIDRHLLAQYNDLNIEIRVNVPHHQLIELFYESDIFALPSLLEGFGHVILEAMSCGLPVIASVHTCGPDVIANEQQGFIVPIRSVEAIVERLTWGMDHREELAAMGQAAAQQVRQLTWQKFRQGIVTAYREMLTAASASTR